MSKTIFPENIITMDGVMMDYRGPSDSYGDGYECDINRFWYGDGSGSGGELINNYYYYESSLGFYREDGSFLYKEYRR